MEKIKVPHAIVIVGVLALMAFLAWQKVDSAPTVMGIVTLLGALGFVIHKQGEQGERSANIQTAVNGNNQRLVDIMEAQQLQFREFAETQQRKMAELAASNQQHMRELADKLAEMVPPSAVPQVIALPVAAENQSS